MKNEIKFISPLMKGTPLGLPQQLLTGATRGMSGNKGLEKHRLDLS